MTDAATVSRLVAAIGPLDDLGEAHRAATLAWLGSTSDVFRRAKPRTPTPHLVSYLLVVDRDAGRVLLADHRLAGKWLPPGGHVEPGEHPLETVRRESREELGIDAELDPASGPVPFFLTVTETVGAPETVHTDVSLWFALAGAVGQALCPDARELADVRWWSRDELLAADPSRLEPHLLRALDALPT